MSESNKINTILTNYGRSLIIKSIVDNTKLLITDYQIGDAVNYIPTENQTKLQGNVLFTNKDQYATDAVMLKLGDNVFELQAVLNSEIGDFEFGEFGFFYRGNLFAIAVFDELKSKIKNSQTRIGNTLNLNIPIAFTNGGTIADLENVKYEIYHSINTLNTEEELPNMNQASPNIYFIKNYNNSGNKAIAIKNYDESQWVFFENQLKFQPKPDQELSEVVDKIVATDENGYLDTTQINRNHLSVLDNNFDLNFNI